MARLGPQSGRRGRQGSKNQHDFDSEPSASRGYAALYLRNFDHDCVQSPRGSGCSIVWRDARGGALGSGHNLHDPGNPFVMNRSGQTTTLGRFLAGANPAYAILSPVIGWIGVVVTGSDNSTNALFGRLQVVAAKEMGISPVLLAASNTTGGCWEKCSLRRASQMAPLRLVSSAAKPRFSVAYSVGLWLSSWDYACWSIFSRCRCWAGWFCDPAKTRENAAQWLTTANFSI
jgi:hypothetical protein